MAMLAIGSFAQRTEDGVYLVSLDSRSGQLGTVAAVRGLPRPAFVAANPCTNLLYGLGNGDDGEGLVYALRLGGRTTLEVVGSLVIGHGAPSYASVHPTGEALYVADWAAGTLVVIPLGKDGMLTEFMAVLPVGPPGVSHPHAAVLFPDARHLAVTDLGQDRLFVYAIGERPLRPRLVHHLAVPSGTGPRHLVFHPSANLGWVIGERASTVCGFVVGAAGALTGSGSTSSLPPDFVADNLAADMVISADGHWLYASNRGHNSVVRYAVDVRQGALSNPRYVESRGWPRSMALVADGAFLVVANEDTGWVESFAVDRLTGQLQAAGALKLDSATSVAVAA